MLIFNKYKSVKLLALSVFTLALSGCLETMKEKYTEGVAATSSVVNSTKKLLDGNDNNTQQTQAKPQQQVQAKPQQQEPAKSASVSKPIVKKTSQQLKNEAKEAQFEHVTYKSPAPDVVVSYTFRSYKGLYIGPAALLDHPGKKINYHDLLSVKDAKHQLNKAKLKKMYNGKGVNAKGPADWLELSWYEMINKLASTTRTYAACKKEVCTEEMVGKKAWDRNSCIKTCSRQTAGWNQFGKSVFENRRSFNNYIDNELDKVFKLAQQAKHEVYIKGRARVTSYQFDLGGFLVKRIHLLNPVGIRGPTSQWDKTKTKLPIFEPKRYGQSPNIKSGILYKMSPAKAEKFTAALNSKAKNNKEVWYVYKVRLRPHKMSYIEKTKMYRVNAMAYDYDVLSSKMEFFYDEALKDKAFELPMK